MCKDCKVHDFLFLSTPELCSSGFTAAISATAVIGNVLPFSAFCTLIGNKHSLIFLNIYTSTLLFPQGSDQIVFAIQEQKRKKLTWEGLRWNCTKWSVFSVLQSLPKICLSFKIFETLNDLLSSCSRAENHLEAVLRLLNISDGDWRQLLGEGGHHFLSSASFIHSSLSNLRSVHSFIAIFAKILWFIHRSVALMVLSNEKKGGRCLVSIDRYWLGLHFLNIFSIF